MIGEIERTEIPTVSIDYPVRMWRGVYLKRLKNRMTGARAVEASITKGRENGRPRWVIVRNEAPAHECVPRLVYSASLTRRGRSSLRDGERATSHDPPVWLNPVYPHR